MLLDCDYGREIGEGVGLKDNFFFLQVEGVEPAKSEGTVNFDGGVEDS